MSHGASMRIGIHVTDLIWSTFLKLSQTTKFNRFMEIIFSGFAYSAAEESITELRSREEFESCDLRNPIKMFTEGLTKVSLDVEGSRYFTSSNPNNCKNGLKLHVEVQPQAAAQKEKKMEDVARAVAEGPKPSGSNCYQGSSLMWFASALIYFVCFPRI